jgi:hypothetical protein
MRLAGYEVEHIAIAYWSRSGFLKDAYFWQAPYDENVSEKACLRLDALKEITAIGVTALPIIPTADTNCTWCPYFLPGITDVTTGCPGHQS